MNEEWRPVVGFEGRYSVSSIGRVKVIRPDGTEAVLRLSTSAYGYPVCGIGITGKDRVVT